METTKILNSKMIILRLNYGLKQNDVAKKLGYSRQYINDIERGRKKGSEKFWIQFGKLFNLNYGEIVDLMGFYYYVQEEKNKVRNNGRIS